MRGLIGYIYNEHTSVGPEDYIVFVWVVPTLEEVEKQVARFNVDIACIRPRDEYQLLNAQCCGKRVLDGSVTEVGRFLYAHTVMWKCGMCKCSKLMFRQHREVLCRCEQALVVGVMVSCSCQTRALVS